MLAKSHFVAWLLMVKHHNAYFASKQSVIKENNCRTIFFFNDSKTSSIGKIHKKKKNSRTKGNSFQQKECTLKAPEKSQRELECALLLLEQTRHA